MNCRFCFTENPDDAVFCKSCGKRLDGTALCGSCSKQIPADSTFCPYCGTPHGKTRPNFTSAPAFGAVAARKINLQKILKYAVPSATLIVALLTLIFVFFIGFSGTSVTIYNGTRSSEVTEYNLFLYFGDAYKKIDAVFAELDSENAPYSDYFASAIYLPSVLGTIVASLTMLSVCALSVSAFVYSVLCLIGKTNKTGGGFAIASLVCYISGVLALFALSNTYIRSIITEYSQMTAECKFNGATVAGVVLGSVFAVGYVAFTVMSRGRELLSVRSIVTCVLSLAGIGLLIAVTAVLSKPALSMNAEDNPESAFSCGVMYILGSLVVTCQGWEEFAMVLNLDEFTAYVVISYVSLVITIVFATFALAGFAKKMSENNGRRHLAVCVLFTVFALLFMAFTIASCNEFIKASGYLGNESPDEIVFIYTVPIVTFVLSIVALAVSSVQCVLLRKKPPVVSSGINEVTEVNAVS